MKKIKWEIVITIMISCAAVFNGSDKVSVEQTESVVKKILSLDLENGESTYSLEGKGMDHSWVISFISAAIGGICTLIGAFWVFKKEQIFI